MDCQYERSPILLFHPADQGFLTHNIEMKYIVLVVDNILSE